MFVVDWAGCQCGRENSPSKADFRHAVLVLLDHEKDAAATRDDFAGKRILREHNILSVGDAFEGGFRSTEADIEDLFDADVYE